MVLNYAEATEGNGMIVALDQAKAYDKLEHNYLWKTLKAFKIPLHTHCTKPILPCLDQGDDKWMLELQFPCNQRCTPRRPLILPPLQPGYWTPVKKIWHERTNSSQNWRETHCNPICWWHNDLSCWNWLTDLNKILDQWCLAAGAQFNTTKTQIIPMGNKTFREKLVQERRARDEHEKIPERIHIAKDGESI